MKYKRLNQEIIEGILWWPGTLAEFRRMAPYHDGIGFRLGLIAAMMVMFAELGCFLAGLVQTYANHLQDHRLLLWSVIGYVVAGLIIYPLAFFSGGTAHKLEL